MKRDQSQQTSILSIGHSTLAYEDFLARLRAAGVTAVADVRSAPFSRSFPQYNRDALKDALKSDGVAYVFLGRELGGRPDTQDCYVDGVADYEKMALKETFQHGLDRLQGGAGVHRIAMMCSERNPLDCHRCLLVGRALKARGVQVEHILGSGDLLTQTEVEAQLLALTNKAHDDMFATEADRLRDAYREHGRRVAFAEPAPQENDRLAG